MLVGAAPEHLVGALDLFRGSRHWREHLHRVAVERSRALTKFTQTRQDGATEAHQTASCFSLYFRREAASASAATGP